MSTPSLTSQQDDERRARPALIPLRALFLTAAGLVVLAAIQLFVLTDRTDHFFAWTVKPPISAAADGAFYLAAVLVLLPATGAREWRRVRSLAFTVLVVSTGKLAATVIHASRFHFHSPDTTARVAAWGWLAVYAVVPPVLFALIVVQLRLRGTDPPGDHPLGSWLRLVASVEALAMSGAGLSLFLEPSWIERAWPWTLTTLTSRSIGAWFLGIAVLAWAVPLENDLDRARWVFATSILLGILQFIVLIRFGDEILWSRPLSWVYVAVFASFIGTGLAGTIAWVRARRGSGHPSGTPSHP